MAADLEDRHDVRVVEDRHGLGLDLESAAVVVGGMGAGQEHLEGDGPVQADLARLVDDANPAVGDLANQLVIAEVGDPASQQGAGIVLAQNRRRPVGILSIPAVGEVGRSRQGTERLGQAVEAVLVGEEIGDLGGQVGMEVVHLLTGLAAPSTQGVAHIYDLMTMEVKREAVVAEPQCPICAHLQPAEQVKETAGG